jgi:hypothetical protein
MEPGMLNENHNKPNWKSRLEEVSSLPDLLLADKNASWEKLHGRLHVKPRRIKPWWYWVAAACLLGAITIPFLTAHKKQEALVKNEPTKTVLKKTGVAASDVKEIVPVAVIAGPVEKKQIATPASLPGSVENKEDKIKDDRLIAATGLDEPTITQQDPIVLPQPVLEAIAVSNPIIAPAPRKLKVIHINELGTPVVLPYNLAHVDDYSPVQIKLINQEIYNNSSTISNNTSFNIFKTRNSPSN